MSLNPVEDAHTGPSMSARASIRRKQDRRKRRVDWAPYIFAAPALLYLLAFIAIPLLRGLYLSLTDTQLLNPSGGSFVGASNYAELLGSSRLYDSVFTTVLYSAGSVVGALSLGLIAALAVNQQFHGRIVARTILTLPWAVPTVAVVLVFSWIFNLENGVANRGVRALGLGEIGWLTDPNVGLISVTLASVWKLFPFAMLVLLAALQGVPGELKDAARTDGANRGQVFRHVTLPHLLPTVQIVALFMTIWSFRRFEIIWLLTGGGPANSTNTIVINVYREAFQNGNLGLASAIGVIGLLMALVVTLAYFMVERRAERKSR